METNTPPKAPGALFNPLTGWEAATRWNAATFDWMTKGFRQWVTLMTTLPPYPTVSAHPQAKTEERAERPVAHSELREPRHTPRAKPKATPKAKPKGRARA